LRGSEIGVNYAETGKNGRDAKDAEGSVPEAVAWRIEQTINGNERQ
jgi:hypothetical protein